jgi:hypothetical protein
MPKIDRSILSLIALTIAAGGAFTVFTKYNVPQLTQSYFGSNPFADKRDVIENTMTWIFSSLALIGVILQAAATALPLSDRLHPARTYWLVFVVSSAAVIVLLWLATWAGTVYARSVWLPQIVRGQSEAYERAAYAIAHNLVLPEHARVDPNSPQYEEIRRTGRETTEKYVRQIEELLEIDPLGNVEERVARLAPHFLKYGQNPTVAAPPSDPQPSP